MLYVVPSAHGVGLALGPGVRVCQGLWSVGVFGVVGGRGSLDEVGTRRSCGCSVSCRSLLSDLHLDLKLGRLILVMYIYIF